MPEPIVLRGCSPTPLASYLKAIGVLRLIASPDNSATGAAADPNARGWWEGDHFRLLTSLDPDALAHYFLQEYAPSPIIAPWNGGSGFYANDNRDGFDPLTARSVAPRFHAISRAIRDAAHILRRSGVRVRPQGAAKEKLVASLRAGLPDHALGWMDAALALSTGLRYPQLLGTGGNDGRLDFTNNFMRRLVASGRSPGLFDAASGSAWSHAGPLLEAALFDAPTPNLVRAAIGQFAPGSAGGANATTGYEAKGSVNPWDFVLMLEGSLAFAGAATRRHEGRSGAAFSFPFTVRATGAGSGGIEAADEAAARAEFWAPLWSRPTRPGEIEALLAEGRAVLNGRTARDGLDFARAAASLGVSRGFSEFERYGFLQRAGNQFLATPLGRRRAQASAGAGLAADLDRGGWLERVRRVGRNKESPASARNAIKRLEDAILGLVASEAPPPRVQSVLTALRGVVAWLSASPGHRAETGAPPPALSFRWARKGNDGSAEFRVAAALASLGYRERLSAPSAPSGPAHAAPERTEGRPWPPPMAAHWAPIEEERFFAGHRAWLPAPSAPVVVWRAGTLTRNLIAVLERRLLEMSVRDRPDKPLAGAVAAGLPEVTAFLAGDFDDARCADLLGGLIWVRPDLYPKQPTASNDRRELPFAYAALKPVFSTDEELRRAKPLEAGRPIPVPPGILPLLRSAAGNDSRRIRDAVHLGLQRARASGIPSLFDERSRGALVAWLGGVAADRLAASLLIPINDLALKALLRRAYPHPEEEPEDAA